MRKIIKSEAIVVATSKWRESSKIVQLFTRDYGYLRVVAKGAFRPKSPFRGVLETLNHIEIVMTYKASRQIQTATSATLLNSFFHIREDLEKTAIGFSQLELLKKLFPLHEPVSGFFQYIVDLLSAMNTKEKGMPAVFLWHFLLQMSETLGFEWQLNYCLKCQQPPEKFPLVLDLENGGFFCGNCGNVASGQNVRISKAQWEHIANLGEQFPAELINFAPGPLPALRPDLTEILLRHISFHTETKLDLLSLKWYG